MLTLCRYSRREGHLVIAPEQSRAGSISAAILLGLSLLLGGGGTPAPLPELVLQVASALVLGCWIYREPDVLQRVPSAVWWIIGLITALHLMQLVPLPPALWQALPGRSAAIASLTLVQGEDSWRPLSLSPLRTVASLLCAISALGVLLITSILHSAARWRLLQTIALIGLATLVVGVGQIKGEAGNPLRFFNPQQVWLTGFQANRNSTADIILIAMLAGAALLWRLRQRQRQPALLVPSALLLFDLTMIAALYLTGSRTGLILLAPVLLVQFLIVQTGRRTQWRGLLPWAAGVMALAVLAANFLRGNRTIVAVIDRFTLEGEFRPELWRDSVFALGQYWPAGSGQGTFVPVMIAAERLEVVDPTLPNRAHNDFLELAIEGGLPGVLILLVIGAILLHAALRALRSEPEERRVQTLFAVAALFLLMLHSLVDYPLRSMALAAVSAAAAGILFRARPKRTGSEESQV